VNNIDPVGPVTYKLSNLETAAEREKDMYAMGICQICLGKPDAILKQPTPMKEV